MLDHALAVAHRHSVKQQEKEATAKLLGELPIEVLKEIAETGEIKLSYGLPCADGSDKSWIEQFKGTPFFQQAIQLEQEELQAQMAQQQSNKVNRQKSDQEFEMMDQIRLKKKLLELQKARNEAQVLDGGAGPTSMTGSNTPGMADAQGAGAPGPMSPEPVQGGAEGKMASVKEALNLSTVGSYLKQQKDPQGLASASRSLMGRGAQQMAGGEAAKGQKYLQAGTIAAQRATTKVAHKMEVLSVGDALGRLMAKVAAPGMGAAVLNWAKKNPSAAGSLALGGAGAAYGALHEGGGLGDAVAYGATGAGLGHMAGGVGSRVHQGENIPAAAKGYIKNTAREATKLTDHVQEAMSPQGK